jgi:uncharacterized protein YdiU (UPF0061 family)
MNTDNMSILGLTIDYGPYGWIDNFDPDWTPNTTDAQGRRYRFGQQAQIAYWNVAQLANALVPAFGSTAPLEAGLQRYIDTYRAAERTNIAAKLGLRECKDEDVLRFGALEELLETGEADMTLFFRGLADVALDAPSLDPLEDSFYDRDKRRSVEARLVSWLHEYAKRALDEAGTASDRRARMNSVNPRFVLRNYLAQQAIDRAEAGDFDGVGELLDVMRHPYSEQPGRETFAARRPDWARNRAGCSMLSCSS